MTNCFLWQEICNCNERKWRAPMAIGASSRSRTIDPHLRRFLGFNNHFEPHCVQLSK